jgi:hypothetical protein
LAGVDQTSRAASDSRRLALADLGAAELQAARPNLHAPKLACPFDADEVIGGALARVGGRRRG